MKISANQFFFLGGGQRQLHRFQIDLPWHGAAAPTPYVLGPSKFGATGQPIRR